eukprot:TRINITY_DN13360_c0_g1_i7.p1 TRINITY_DN13360_c0_g1~~TRINITY_DN13360_c0_g1_i7.p1  ORF type:complete len:462 (+),score=100.52 TRINITY_DN13360_c0_g1_i7:162-1547(+)
MKIFENSTEILDVSETPSAFCLFSRQERDDSVDSLEDCQGENTLLDPDCDSDYDSLNFSTSSSDSSDFEGSLVEKVTDGVGEPDSNAVKDEITSTEDFFLMKKLKQLEARLWVLDKRIRNTPHEINDVDHLKERIQEAEDILNSYFILIEDNHENESIDSTESKEPTEEDEEEDEQKREPFHIVHQFSIIPQTITAGRWRQYYHYNTPWFQSYFANRPYIVALGIDKEGLDCVAIIKAEERILGLTPVIRGIITNSQSTVYCLLDEKEVNIEVIHEWTKCWHFIIEQMLPQLRSSVSFDIIQSPIFEEAYLGFEKNAISRFLRTNFCVGILVMKKDQKTEEEFFSNMQVSRSFMHFFLSIAKIVELKGWSRYDGELDTTKGRNGTHSLYTMGYGIEIMFHVSTMLAPGSEGHVSKKRYIGNDSVVIIFQELGCTKPFAISSMPSHMNRVFIVVKALPKYNR